MKQGPSTVALDLGESPRPKAPSRAVTRMSTSIPYSAAVAVGAVAGKLAATIQCGLWRVSQQTDVALSRFLAYLDLVSAGQVSWKCFYSDACSLAREVIHECKTSSQMLASRTRGAGVEAATLSVRFAAFR